MHNKNKQLLLHLLLFVITIVTTSLAGAEWMYSKFLFFVPEEYAMSWQDFLGGLQFAWPFLLILTCHEFGHYFTARYYHIRVTLPYYIPMWLGFLLIPSLGTMGAFIRIKDPIYTLKHYFDIGIAGPLAGFVVALGVIFYGYTHLPEPESIFKIHPEYAAYGMDYASHVYTYEFGREQDSLHYVAARTADSLKFAAGHPDGSWTYPNFQPQASYSSMYFGKPLLFELVEKYLVTDQDRIPPKQELMHYPLLLAGLLALFFTALNLLPIGQLDGGHILFGLIGGKRHAIVSKVLFTVLIFYSGLGIVAINSIPDDTLSSALNLLILIGGYLYFLYICATSLFPNKQHRLLYASIIIAVQFVVNFFFHVEGYSGWLLFGLLLGRFLGVVHPPVRDSTPLTPVRKMLGWLALIIFILSFSPEPLVLG